MITRELTGQQTFFYNLKTHTKHQRENSAFTFINNAEYIYM